jgi:hypothetical protein
MFVKKYRFAQNGHAGGHRASRVRMDDGSRICGRQANNLKVYRVKR